MYPIPRALECVGDKLAHMLLVLDDQHQLRHVRCIHPNDERGTGKREGLVKAVPTAQKSRPSGFVAVHPDTLDGSPGTLSPPCPSAYD